MILSGIVYRVNPVTGISEIWTYDGQVFFRHIKAKTEVWKEIAHAVVIV
jgi:hypothetical protein